MGLSGSGYVCRGQEACFDEAVVHQLPRLVKVRRPGGTAGDDPRDAFVDDILQAGVGQQRWERPSKMPVDGPALTKRPDPVLSRGVEPMSEWMCAVNRGHGAGIDFLDQKPATGP